jgi:CobQ-like glutamine amidotransferase family enzyme
MLKIALVYPELLGTYGDGGNALVLHSRALRRGYDVEVSEIPFGADLGNADLYLLGGGEDGPQRQATDALRRAEFGARVANGAAVFAVCAGLQLLGHEFAVEGDEFYQGLGLLDVRTRRGAQRSVGNLVTDTAHGVMVGFENHGGVSELGVGTEAFGKVRRGRGNDGSVDGCQDGRIVATYAHGPALALNPWLADYVLAMVLETPLEPLDSLADRLYAERVRRLA